MICQECGNTTQHEPLCLNCRELVPIHCEECNILHLTSDETETLCPSCTELHETTN